MVRTDSDTCLASRLIRSLHRTPQTTVSKQRGFLRASGPTLRPEQPLTRPPPPREQTEQENRETQESLGKTLGGHLRQLEIHSLRDKGQPVTRA